MAISDTRIYNGKDNRGPKPKTIVSMSNALIMGAHHLNDSEKKLMCVAISKINPLDRAEAEPEILITVDDLVEFCNGDREIAYYLLNNGSKNLFEREVHYFEKDPKDGVMQECWSRWITDVAIKHNASVKFEFHSKVFKMLTKLTGNFTQYKLESVMKLKKKGAIRLFEILMQRADGSNEFDDGLAHRIILKKDLHVALGLSSSAIKHNHLEMRHLNPYMAEINEYLHMNLTGIENANSWHFTYNTRDKIETEQSVVNTKTVKKVIPPWIQDKYGAEWIYKRVMEGADVAQIILNAIEAAERDKKRIADNSIITSKKEQS